MGTIHHFLVVGSVSLALVAPAAAQDAHLNQWSRATTLSGFAGAAGDASQTGSLFGGTAGWDVTPAVAIEGAGSWMDFGPDHGFGAAVKVRMRLAGKRTVDPFVQAGIGMYRASFAGDSTLPEFYARRADPALNTAGTVFTDPTVIGGGGLTVFVNRRVAVRPVFEATMAFRDGHSRTMMSVAVHAVFFFEHHPVTQARR
jgi:hypothetical protein